MEGRNRNDKVTAPLARVELEALAMYSMRAPTVAGEPTRSPESCARGSDAVPIPTPEPVHVAADDLVIALEGEAPDPRSVLTALAPRPAVLVEDEPLARPALRLELTAPPAKQSDLGIMLASVLVILAIAAAIFAVVRYS
ncbi:MAG: hypothetical protein WKG01_19910 [Kofleriaceae bacterium]